MYYPGAPLTYFNDGGVRVIFLGLKFWPKVIFWGLWKTPGFFGVAKKTEVVFLGCKKKIKGFFLQLQKKISDFFG